VTARLSSFAALGLRAGLCLASLAIAANGARAFDIAGRWGATQLDGGGLQRGDPVTLRWSVVPDGRSYSRASNSKLIAFLDDGWNVPAASRTPTFTTRPWWTVMSNAYAQFGRVSGITMTYVAEANAAGASTGLVGDIRIGGDNIDGTPGGALADNTFPDDGDMRIDVTRETNGSVGSYFSTEPGLRNLMIHESGHGVGLGHAQFVNDSAKAIMEGGLRTDIWGLQFDDVYALNRQYGDPKERMGNSASTAIPLGSLTTASPPISVGTDAADSVVNQMDDDWLGIDGSNDFDWFRFTVTEPGFARIRLTPQGPTYTTPQQGVFNAAAQSDLVMQAFGPGAGLSWRSDQTALGGVEEISSLYFSTLGDYVLRINGKQDLNQFYRLDLLFRDRPGSGLSADLNLDNVTSIDDWKLFVEKSYTTLPPVTGVDAFVLGDLDYDGDNDMDDFRLFKSAFDRANGAGSFAAMLGVPEPATAGLLAVAACAGGGYLRSPRRRGLRRNVAT
jgi:hypothetical protein